MSLVFTYHGDELDLVLANWPKQLPPKAVTLGDVGWAFSPGSSRFDTYKGWISLKARRAFIWWRNPGFPEDLGVPAKFRPYASGPLSESPKLALRSTLAFAWARESADCDLPIPSEMHTGFLNGADFSVVCQEVWLRVADTEDETPTSHEPSMPDAWAAKATWHDEGCHGASGIHRGFQMALRRQAARVYAERHLLAHGCLPTGTVTVRYKYAPTGKFADLVTPFGSPGTD